MTYGDSRDDGFHEMEIDGTTVEAHRTAGSWQLFDGEELIGDAVVRHGRFFPVRADGRGLPRGFWKAFDMEPGFRTLEACARFLVSIR